MPALSKVPPSARGRGQPQGHGLQLNRSKLVGIAWLAHEREGGIEGGVKVKRVRGHDDLDAGGRANDSSEATAFDDGLDGVKAVLGKSRDPANHEIKADLEDISVGTIGDVSPQAEDDLGDGKDGEDLLDNDGGVARPQQV